MNQKNKKTNEINADNMVFSKKRMFIVIGLLLVMCLVYSLSLNSTTKYEYGDGIVVEKYIISETQLFGLSEDYTYYCYTVDCNGINRTHIMISENLLEWKYKQIGDSQIVCWEV